MNKTSEQFLRVKRWLKRFKQAHKEKAYKQNDPEYGKDILYAFFQNCFHLKDWIINSSNLPRDDINRFINSDTDMKICRDLCNASKHLTISRSSIDPNISVSKNKGKFSINKKSEKIIHYWIKVKRYPLIDALRLAEACVVKWEAFLKRHSLI